MLQTQLKKKEELVENCFNLYYKINTHMIKELQVFASPP